MMRLFVSKILRKFGFMVAGALVLFNTVVAGSILVSQPVSASTISCHHQTSTQLTNVIFNGLSGGSDVSKLIKSFQTIYKANSDGHYSDIQKVYNWGGAGLSLVNGMNTSNTFLGYSHNDGTVHVKINGVDTVVGTNMQIAARWGEADTWNFTQIPNTGVCMHSYKRWFSTGRGSGPDVPTLIHINQTTGVADFGMWRDCGNMITFTKVPLKPQLQCVSLDKKLTDDSQNSVSYQFTATASRKYTQITHYDFNLDTSKSLFQRVNVNDATTANTTHTYSKTDVEQTINITVTVSSSTKTVGSSNCAVQIVVPPKQQLTFSCKQLAATLTANQSDHRSYSFVASTQGTDTAKSYSFYFINTDGSTVKIDTGSDNTASHVYGIDASKVETGKAYFVATSQTGLVTDKNDANCQFQFTVRPLVRTGPEGALGLFAASSTLGIGLHQLIIRRKLSA